MYHKLGKPQEKRRLTLSPPWIGEKEGRKVKKCRRLRRVAVTKLSSSSSEFVHCLRGRAHVLASLSIKWSLCPVAWGGNTLGIVCRHVGQTGAGSLSPPGRIPAACPPSRTRLTSSFSRNAGSSTAVMVSPILGVSSLCPAGEKNPAQGGCGGFNASTLSHRSHGDISRFVRRRHADHSI